MISWLYTFFKGLRNKSIVDAMKAREPKEIEIRDKMMILFNLLLVRLGEEYKEARGEPMEDAEKMI